MAYPLIIVGSPLSFTLKGAGPVTDLPTGTAPGGVAWGGPLAGNTRYLGNWSGATEYYSAYDTVGYASQDMSLFPLYGGLVQSLTFTLPLDPAHYWISGIPAGKARLEIHGMITVDGIANPLLTGINLGLTPVGLTGDQAAPSSTVPAMAAVSLTIPPSGARTPDYYGFTMTSTTHTDWWKFENRPGDRLLGIGNIISNNYAGGVPDVVVTQFSMTAYLMCGWTYWEKVQVDIDQVILKLWVGDGPPDGPPTVCIGACIVVWLTGSPHSGTAGDWVIKDSGGGTVASNTSAAGWSITHNADGSYTICVPCGATAGTYTVTYQIDASNSCTFTLIVQDCGLCGGGHDAAIPLTGPWLVQDNWGRLHQANTRASGGIEYHRSDHGTPPWAMTASVTTNALDYCPRMIVDERNIITMVFSRGDTTASAVYSTYSWDDGNTWGGPTLVSTGGISMYGTINSGPQDGLQIMAWMEVSGGIGTLKGRRRDTGDAAWSSAFTMQGIGLGGGALANLQSEVDTFHLAQEVQGGVRWTLTFTAHGDSTPGVWVSSDKGATWKRVL